MKILSISATKNFVANLPKKNDHAPFLTFTSKHDSVDLNKDKNKKSKLKKAVPIVLLTALASVAGGFYLYKKGKLDLSKINSKIPVSPTNQKTWLAIAGLCGLGSYEAGKITVKDKNEIISKIENGQTPLQETLKSSEKATNSHSLINKYTKNYRLRNDTTTKKIRRKTRKDRIYR